MPTRRFVALLAVVLGSALPAQPVQCPSSWIPGYGGFGVNSIINDMVEFDDGSGPAMYVGGLFNAAGGQSANYVARWNGTSWTPVGAGFNASVRSLCVHDDGTGPALYAGGNFTSSGGTNCLYVARWTGTAWVAAGTLATTASGFGVDDLLSFDDGTGPALYAGGFFYAQGHAYLARLVGGSWQGLPGGGPNVSVRSLAVYDDGTGPRLYACGDFFSAGGTAATKIARWNGNSWSALGSTPLVNMPGSVVFVAYTMHVHDDGTGPALYVGGAFGGTTTVSSPGIIRWNGTVWSSAGGGVTGAIWNGFTPFAIPGVFGMATFDDGSGSRLYATGNFQQAGGAPASGIAELKNGSWAPLAGGLNYIGLTLRSWDDGSGTGPALFAGGYFTGVNGYACGGIAKWGHPSLTLSMSQPGGPGTGVVVSHAGLVPSRTYRSFFSYEPCAVLGGGPWLGLCFTDIPFLLWQFEMPPGAVPFHFVASGATAATPPISLPAGLTLEGLTLDVTNGQLGCVSPVAPFVVQ